VSDLKSGRAASLAALSGSSNESVTGQEAPDAEKFQTVLQLLSTQAFDLTTAGQNKANLSLSSSRAK
jgi:hypothetical protein